MFSARGAGILGFSIFGAKKIYALKDNMELDIEALKGFLEEYRGKKILLFGFTFMVWQHFYHRLSELKKQGKSFDLSNGILIHGGGWKKLISEAVSREQFQEALAQVCGLSRIYDYYGMVEQTGCIYTVPSVTDARPWKAAASGFPKRKRSRRLLITKEPFRTARWNTARHLTSKQSAMGQLPRFLIKAAIRKYFPSALRESWKQKATARHPLRLPLRIRLWMSMEKQRKKSSVPAMEKNCMRH